MEKILLFNVENTAPIKTLLSPMKIKVFSVPKELYDSPLKKIVDSKLPTENETSEGTENSESLMLFCNISDKKMDKILFKMRQQNISVTYKAMLTPTNSTWTVKRLFLELMREHIAYSQMHK